MKLRLDGMKDLERNLQRIEKRATQKAVLRRALKKAAEPMRAVAEAKAPRASGDLAKSIKISSKIVDEVGATAYHAAMRAGGSKGDALAAMRSARRALKASGGGAAVELYLGPTKEIFYGRFQELGTAHNPPHPFLRPAFDSEARPTIDRLAPIIWDEIEKSLSRIKAKG